MPGPHRSCAEGRLELRPHLLRSVRRPSTRAFRTARRSRTKPRCRCARLCVASAPAQSPCGKQNILVLNDEAHHAYRIVADVIEDEALEDAEALDEETVEEFVQEAGRVDSVGCRQR